MSSNSKFRNEIEDFLFKKRLEVGKTMLIAFQKLEGNNTFCNVSLRMDDGDLISLERCKVEEYENIQHSFKLYCYDPKPQIYGVGFQQLVDITRYEPEKKSKP